MYIQTLTFQNQSPNNQLINLPKSMGNICSCLCPRRNKRPQASYDVHEQTFEMQENIDSMNMEDEFSPKINENIPIANSDTQFADSSERQSMHGLKHQKDQSRIQDEKDKYVERTATASKPSVAIQEDEGQAMVDQKDEELLSSTSEMKQEAPLIPKQQQQKSSEMQPEQSETQKPQTIQRQPSPPPVKKPNPNILKPKNPAKKKVNIEDYRFKNESDQFKVKKLNTLNGQQFNIDHCENCEYYIFDVTGNVYIDNSNNCKIFIAPCESTVFIRNCSNLLLIAATKQFRTFKCFDSEFSLLCKSQPVIESSNNLTFTSFQFPNYVPLQKQLESMKLEIWNNHWSEIHNFTKKEGEVHYQLQRNFQIEGKLDWKKGFEMGEIEYAEGSVIPLILGELPLKQQEENQNTGLILFNANNSKDDHKMLEFLQDHVSLKAFKGPVTGFGKEQRVAVLFRYSEQLKRREQLEESGQLYLQKEEVEKYKNQFFINFGDQRQK